MRDVRERYGPWGLVTGASSGIGEEFARQLARAGLHLVLVARREERLAALATALEREHGVESRVVAADLARADFLDAVLPAVRDLEVGLLVNNAGFSTTGEFLDADVQRQLDLVHVNCRAPVLLTHALVPAMRARGRGGVIFTASTVGLLGGAALWTHYCASKGFDALFAEGLARELAPYGVDVQALCPGGTRTDFQATAGISGGNLGGLLERSFFMDPADVVAESLRKLGRATVVVPGLANKLNVLSSRLLPRRLNSVILGQVVRRMRTAH